MDSALLPGSMAGHWEHAKARMSNNVYSLLVTGSRKQGEWRVCFPRNSCVGGLVELWHKPSGAWHKAFHCTMQYVMLLAGSHHPFTSARVPKETTASLVLSQTFGLCLGFTSLSGTLWDGNKPFISVSQASKPKQILSFGSPWCITLP